MSYLLNDEQIKQLRLLYSRRTDKELAMHFGVAVSYIEDLARRLCLGKDKLSFRGRGMPRWGAREMEVLRELYGTTPNIEIARRLGRTVKAIDSKAHHMGLRKELDRLIGMGRENVEKRWRNPQDEEMD